MPYLAAGADDLAAVLAHEVGGAGADPGQPVAVTIHVGGAIVRAVDVIMRAEVAV